MGRDFLLGLRGSFQNDVATKQKSGGLSYVRDTWVSRSFEGGENSEDRGMRLQQDLAKMEVRTQAAKALQRPHAEQVVATSLECSQAWGHPITQPLEICDQLLRELHELAAVRSKSFLDNLV